VARGVQRGAGHQAVPQTGAVGGAGAFPGGVHHAGVDLGERPALGLLPDQGGGVEVTLPWILQHPVDDAVERIACGDGSMGGHVQLARGERAA
jgi:hypothetical protein